jgi:Cd2+/Zn2+-exporting ATPase
MDRVQKILAGDGAAIVNPVATEVGSHNHSHHSHSHQGHDHGHQHGPSIKLLIGISAILFLAAILCENQWSETAAIALYLLAAVISGYQTFLKGLKNLFSLKFNIDTLMTISLVGAFCIGQWREGTIVAILFGINEYLEGLGMEKARKSMESLLEVAPKEAVLFTNGEERVVPIASLKAGDTVLVKAGQKIPSDGIIIEGISSVNEAAITGESMPLSKQKGEAVFGGSLNHEGLLKIQLEKAYQDSSLAKILHLVEEAQETKTPTEQFINRFARYYTPIIMLFAAMVILVPPLFMGGDWHKWIYQGLAVLIVGCPCALIISSPIAIVSGITRNARNGILVKGGIYLEQLGKLDIIAFDKTGTLTKGEPTVAEIKKYDDTFLSVAGSVEKSSSHPLAKAVMKKVAAAKADILEPENVTAIPGQGVRAVINGVEYFIGNEKGLDSAILSKTIEMDIQDLKSQGYTLVAAASKEKVLGLFGIADEIRLESRQMIHTLHGLGIKETVMLTGDHQKTAEKVSGSIGLREFYAGLLPDEKVEKVRALTKNGRTAMVGDGINDAPALAAADIGIAMGKGTDSAIETADIVLMQDHLGKLPSAISVSKKVNRVIKLNIGLALGLKVAALLLTIPGWLTLWIAILSDMGATILVTLVSLTVLIETKTTRSVQAPAIQTPDTTL